MIFKLTNLNKTIVCCIINALNYHSLKFSNPKVLRGRPLCHGPPLRLKKRKNVKQNQAAFASIRGLAEPSKTFCVRHWTQ